MGLRTGCPMGSYGISYGTTCGMPDGVSHATPHGASNEHPMGCPIKRSSHRVSGFTWKILNYCMQFVAVSPAPPGDAGLNRCQNHITSILNTEYLFLGDSPSTQKTQQRETTEGPEPSRRNDNRAVAVQCVTSRDGGYIYDDTDDIQGYNISVNMKKK